MIPTRWEVIVEVVYREVGEMARENMGEKWGRYYQMVLTLVMSIGVMNVLGLLPYVYVPTTQIVVAMGLSVVILVGITVRGVVTHGRDFMSMMMPVGIPLVLGPFMVVVETVSYLSRGVSLGVRLAANITAGHLLYSILTGFAYEMGMVGVVPLVILGMVMVLEVGVALIQAYVYGLLVSIYIGEVGSH